MSAARLVSSLRNAVAADRLVLTANEVAALLRVHPTTVRAMVAAGSLPAIRAGRLLRFSRVAIERWLDEGGAQ